MKKARDKASLPHTPNRSTPGHPQGRHRLTPHVSSFTLPTWHAFPPVSTPAPHPNPGNTIAPIRRQAPGRPSTASHSTLPATHLHAGSNHLNLDAQSACSDQSQRQAILPVSHSLPFTTLLPAAPASTPLGESVGNTDTENRRDCPHAARYSNTNADHCPQRPGNLAVHHPDNDVP